ncbi:tetratricopeptide repeat protein [Sphingomonas sp.]|uniref:tetratricopeptide repeat protein n=1 Tax=Sphingomonas sp. TaxID=28214 RepID=UPI002E300A35|nr:tetratricopeptide repeat protein [Sphingomonas sp.]HEX4693721.1 tetratricopeptide repeat protein [Sphingomonas sp.]
MRFSPAALAVVFAGLSISTSLQGQGVGAPVDPRSMALLAQGRADAAAGNLQGATDLIETALVVDPRNRAAFLELAAVAERQGLPGKAIRLYREALLIEPNDPAALRGQGEALVAKGAIGPARENLAKIKTLCGKKPCPDAVSLSASIAKGPPPSATPPATVPETADASK